MTIATRLASTVATTALLSTAALAAGGMLSPASAALPVDPGVEVGSTGGSPTPDQQSCNTVVGTDPLAYQRPVHRVTGGLHMGSLGDLNRDSGQLHLSTAVSNTYWLEGYKSGTTVVLKNRCGQGMYAVNQHGWVDAKAFGQSKNNFSDNYVVPEPIAERTASIEVIHEHTPQGFFNWYRSNRDSLCGVYAVVRIFAPDLPSTCVLPKI